MRVLSGIVTYNPNINRLKENISSIISQNTDVLIIDNGSSNCLQIKELIGIYEKKIIFIQNDENLGIAMALKQIMDFAVQKNYEWVLTLDQDSVAECELIDKYKIAIKEHADLSIGMLSCLIKDRNFTDVRNEKQNKSIQEIPFCITSGTLANVKAYFKTNGYPTEFFIDCVDFDICYSLKECGYKIYRVNYIGLIHEVGKAENKKLIFRRINVYHHNASRVFTFTRNMIWMQKRHPKYVNKIFLLRQLTKEMIKIAVFEEAKKEKMFSFLRGIKAGLKA